MLGQHVLDFIDKIQSLEDYDEICIAVAEELAKYGLSYVTSLNIPAPGQSLQKNILLNSRPEEFTKRYAEKNYILTDPNVTYLQRTLDPYTWTDVKIICDLSKNEKNIINEASEFGANNGMVIPMVKRYGVSSIFCPCGHNPNLSIKARKELEIIGVYSHQALDKARLKLIRKVETHTPLTAREREVMQWVATGKSDYEIGEILTISSRTVTTHVNNSMVKLDAYKRPYAVVKCIQYGEIFI